ncbi:MAG: PAS domain S-box protein, partial [bacterium]
MKNGIKILVVEDSPTQAEKLKFILEDENYFVTMAYNASEALNFLNSTKKLPDLIITDIVMPGMNGYELTKQIKSDKNLKEIPVILLTSLSNPTDILKGLECGANNFISKPYEEKFMLERVEYFLLHNKISKLPDKKGYIEFMFKGEKYNIPSDSQKVLGFLISSYETAVDKNLELSRAKDELIFLNTKLDDRVKERTAKLLEEINVREKIEEQLKHTNTVLKAIRNVNQLITHERNPKVLIREACNKLVEGRGYHYTRIVTLDKNNKITDFADAALDNQNKNEIQYKDINDVPYCMRKALEQQEIFIFNNSNEECKNCKACHGKPEYYTVSLRLEFENIIYGIVSVSIPLDIAYDKEDESLFHELAGDISFALATIRRDVEKRKIEESLREIEERFRCVFDNATDGILLADLEDKKFIMPNKEICNMLGYTEEEFLNLSVRDIHPQNAIEYVIKQFEKQERKEIQVAANIPLLRKNGSIFFADINSTPIRIGSKGYLLGIFRDITERKKAEESLRESEERYRNIFENAAVGIFRTSLDGHFQLANPTLVKMLGYDTFDELAQLNLEKDGFETGYQRNEFRELIERDGKIIG